MILVSRPCYPGRRLPRNTEVIPNGIIPVQAGARAEKALQVPIRLGFVGRFHENKGMDLLLDWSGRSGTQASTSPSPCADVRIRKALNTGTTSSGGFMMKDYPRLSAMTAG